MQKKYAIRTLKNTEKIPSIFLIMQGKYSKCEIANAILNYNA